MNNVYIAWTFAYSSRECISLLFLIKYLPRCRSTAFYASSLFPERHFHTRQSWEFEINSSMGQLARDSPGLGAANTEQSSFIWSSQLYNVSWRSFTTLTSLRFLFRAYQGYTCWHLENNESPSVPTSLANTNNEKRDLRLHFKMQRQDSGLTSQCRPL